jgi:hypothetical protein
VQPVTFLPLHALRSTLADVERVAADLREQIARMEASEERSSAILGQPEGGEDDDLLEYWEAANLLDRSVNAARKLAERKGWTVYVGPRKPRISMRKVVAYLQSRPGPKP